MTVNYVADDLMQPLRQGRILELRQTPAVIEDTATRRRWALPYAAVIVAPPPRLKSHRTPHRHHLERSGLTSWWGIPSPSRIST
ncbi:hypothetical protein [Cupriavidus sp. D39]|uniref:hypothetical protein n=1 Tax=Cupriavidus sp. D39 TaxID=2997877 RepID=UPI00227136FC|nr:hypothetical protein [Cupriavidus sp. D39]MCY0853992.1 hypothetical protein [Cupriavidus sp. D39]